MSGIITTTAICYVNDEAILKTSRIPWMLVGHVKLHWINRLISIELSYILTSRSGCDYWPLWPLWWMFGDNITLQHNCLIIRVQLCLKLKLLLCIVPVLWHKTPLRLYIICTFRRYFIMVSTETHCVINHLRAKYLVGTKLIFTFYVSPPYWHNTGSWNSSSSKTRTYLSYTVHIMGADALVTRGARASAAIILLVEPN